MSCSTTSLQTDFLFKVRRELPLNGKVHWPRLLWTVPLDVEIQDQLAERQFHLANSVESPGTRMLSVTEPESKLFS